MRNVPFVVWMLGFYALNEFSNSRPNIQPTSTSEVIVSVIYIAIWFGVGYLLYEKKPDSEDDK